MKTEYICSQYDPAQVAIGIVHLGLGAFVRAHLAVYTEKLLNANANANANANGNGREGKLDWGICAANIRSNRQLVDQMNAQGLRYTVAEYEDEGSVTLREINSIREVLYAGDGETAELLARLVEPNVRIVSLTVTEKGYYFDLGRHQLMIDHPDIQHDLVHPEAPKTAPGIILAGLKARREKKLPPFSVLSCDNMPHNGAATRQAILQLAQRLDADLAVWIRDQVSFPSTMVDRIVPAATPESIEGVRPLIKAYSDEIPVPCESFTQWVIEDQFAGGRPNWDVVGATFVDEVAPWEEMKLRMLNGSHSLLAYLGFLGGLEYVSDCVKEPEYVQLLRTYMLREAAPTLAMPEGTDLQEYAGRLLERFANDSLRHKTAQIAMDGSQKIPQRWLAGAQILLERNVMPKATALGIAGWIRYVSGEDECGKSIVVNDPLAEQLKAMSNSTQDAGEVVGAFFALSMFSAVNEAAGGKALADEVTDFLLRLRREGARATVSAFVREQRAY